MKKIVAAVLAACVTAVASQEWTVWPCYGGGYVQNVVIAPSNPRVWYAYVDVGGPYRSDDAGRHWRPLHGNLAGVHRNVSGDCVRTLDVDPRDENSFVMCSGGTFDHPAGIFVSRDGGASFRKTRCGRFYGNGVRRMLGLVLGRNPNSPDELVAGEDWDGVALSTDNGETWNTVGLERTWLTDLRYDRAVSNRIYACANPPNHLMSPDAKGACEFQGRTYDIGLFRSDDGGRKWRKLSANAPFEICQIKGRDELIAYFHEQGVKRSRDGGETWEDFAQGLEAAPLVNTGSSLSPGRYQAFGAGRDFYLVGNGKGGIYRRHVDAEAWTKVEVVEKRAGVPEKEPRLQYMTGHPMDALGSLIVDPQNDRHWLATDWFEIWETADAGAHWTSRIHGIMQLVSFTVECDPFSEKNIIYGVADMGLFSSQDGGAAFHPYAESNLGECSFVSFDAHVPDLVVAGISSDRSVAVSRDGGRHWDVLPGSERVPSGCSSKVLVDRKRLFYLSTGSGVFTRKLP